MTPIEEAIAALDAAILDLVVQRARLQQIAARPEPEPVEEVTGCPHHEVLRVQTMGPGDGAAFCKACGEPVMDEG